MPAMLWHVWEWFIEVNEGRSYSDIGAHPLTYSDLKHWADLMGAYPMPSEIRLLKQIDHLFLTTK